MDVFRDYYSNNLSQVIRRVIYNKVSQLLCVKGNNTTSAE